MKTAVLKWLTQKSSSWSKFLPARIVAQLKLNTPVLILRDKEITVYLWLGDRFDDGARFAQSNAGQQAFAHFLAKTKLSGTAYLLADMIDDELLVETIPILRRGDRKGLVNRRLERMFRHTPYRRASFQGRQVGGGERVLFSALTTPNLVQPWVEQLRGSGMVIAGLWSVSLLGRDLMRHISTTTTNALLISLNDTGQRHTYFHQGRTLVSRLIPSNYSNSEQVAEAVFSETKRTRLYLNVLRLLRQEIPLDVYVLCHDALAAVLRQYPAQASDYHIQPLLIGDMVERLGLAFRQFGQFGQSAATVDASSAGNRNSMTHPDHDHRFGHWIPASAGMTGEKVVRHSRESGNPEGYELPLSSTSGGEERSTDLLIGQYLLLNSLPNHYAVADGMPSQAMDWHTVLRSKVLKWLPLPQSLASSVTTTVSIPQTSGDATAATGEEEGRDKSSPARPVRRIGDLLLEKGAISRHQLEIAISEQKRIGQPFGKTLIALGFISEEAMRDLLGEALAQETANLDIPAVDAEALRQIPKEFAKRHSVLPLAWDTTKKTLTVAMANTLNMVAIDKLHALLPKEVIVRPLLAGESELATAIDRFYGFDLSVDGILREIETGEVDLESLAVDDGTFHHPMVRLANALITDAVKHGASDMHINPMASFTQIRYRIDGVLQEARILHRKFFSGLSVRIKIMSSMDIAETRMPQDGHFSGVIANNNIDFRISTQPTVHGENIVLRILDRSKGLLGLHNLGLSSENKTLLKKMIARPEGIVLVTGPTGSGKTTTLYAMLSTLDAKKSNIMTLEDPVEYLLDSILQTSVNKAVDLDFSSGVRSMLRQDPDIILVGEIRDLDTAQMALRAAMTGHKVYSTLHANSALAAIFRLLNIGLRPDMLAGNIIGVLGQRLVRTLCRNCKRPVAPGTEQQQLLDFNSAEKIVSTEKIGLYSAVGCNVCNATGYKGRVCVMEGVIIDDDFDDLISSNAPQGEFRRLARKKGILTMADFGRRLVLAGTADVEEFARVFGMTTTTETRADA